MGYRNYSTAVSHIVDTTGQGDFTTIGAALSAASSGQTIFIRPGTYTENITLKAGVNLAAYDCDASTPNVTILGTTTASYNGSVSISGVQFQTNGATACLNVTSANSSFLYFTNCWINSSSNTGVTTNAANFSIFFYSCIFKEASNNIVFAITNIGGVTIDGCDVPSGGSTGSSTVAGGTVSIQNSILNFPFTTSSTANVNISNSQISPPSNTTAITTAGTGGMSAFQSYIASGTASAVSIGAGTTGTITSCTINSSNANAITGAGTLIYGGIVFQGTATINTTTQTPIAFSVPQGGTGNTSATAYAVQCGGTTSTGAFQSIASVGTSGQVLTSNGAGALPTFQAAAGGGAVVQQVRTSTSTAGSTSTTFSWNNTIPQNTGGAQVLSVAITPTNSSHILLIEYSHFVTGQGPVSGTQHLISALFQDSTANAIYSQLDFELSGTGTGTENGGINVIGRFYMTAGTTSSTTIKLRVGPDSGTYYWLSDRGTAVLSTSIFASLTVTEYTT